MNEPNEPATTTLKRKQHKNMSNNSTSHSPKKTKSQNDDIAAKGAETACITSESPKHNKHPKSRKELRAEKKALKKAAPSTTEKTSEKPTELSREDEKLLSKENQKITKKEQRLLVVKEQRKEKRLKKLKRLRGEMDAPEPGGDDEAQSKKLKQTHNQSDADSGEKEGKKKSQQEKDSVMNIYNHLFNGTHDDTAGLTTLRMGVKYIDVVEGKGPVAEKGNLVSVSYKLKGDKFGAVIDSSKNLYFRLGLGKVIKGWDIGVV
eukprot:CAMPEP_0201922622 /NCGR_PEP_ID=MMETSP0903-20130614/10605_1 /ASSEMBLY_ACC=CAM_ASM_000552 /TAXON_ID=420261 /ORGANISM="Thalassiosira antarctica, Strain CCMP982" /LENGTH=261 /DNA_ID=CAMNT_0048459791 /DNA_START=210 /DNA_END=991 /DNA_ORIENTATION=+